MALYRIEQAPKAGTTRILEFDEALLEYRTNAQFNQKVELFLYEIAFPKISIEVGKQSTSRPRAIAEEMARQHFAVRI